MKTALINSSHCYTPTRSPLHNPFNDSRRLLRASITAYAALASGEECGNCLLYQDDYAVSPGKAKPCLFAEHQDLSPKYFLNGSEI